MSHAVTMALNRDILVTWTTRLAFTRNQRFTLTLSTNSHMKTKLNTRLPERRICTKRQNERKWICLKKKASLGLVCTIKPSLSLQALHLPHRPTEHTCMHVFHHNKSLIVLHVAVIFTFDPQVRKVKQW